jgi:hypothetical protein
LSWPWSSERPRAEDSGLRRRVPAESRREAERRTGSRSWRRLLDGSAPEPVPAHHGTVEDPEAGKVGICCSGGGIRSAAFCLGALQSLQEEGELRRAAYLAAVSGGSYIAGALSMVALSDESAAGGAGGNSDAERLRRLRPFAPGSPEEQYLRNRSSYLAPTLTDKVYLGWRMLLGLLFNLVFIATPLAGLTLILTGLFYSPLVPDLAGPCGTACAAHLPAGFWIAPLATLGVAVLGGLATLLLRFRTDRRARIFAVWATRALILAAVLALLLVALPHLVDWIDGSPQQGETVTPSTEEAAPGVSAALLALIAGVIAQLGHLLSSKEASEGMGWARKAFSRLGAGARLTLTYLAAALAGPFLLLAVVALTLAVGLGQASAGRVDLSPIVVGAAVLAGWAVVYAFADLTSWSLHPYYKRRLSSAFALKRIAAADLEGSERGRVEAIVPDAGNEDPGIAVERDFDELVPLSETALSEAQAKEWPTLLVCASANVSDVGATPPGRAVTSFTFSAHTVGGPLVGAVASWEMETPFESRAEAFPDPSASKPQQPRTIFKWAADRARARRRRDLTLPAAIAMSGAAVSPSMGKMTKRPLTFLMALANLRLGVWVPNPRWLGEWNRDQRLRNRNLRPRPSYLLRELFGLNRIGAKYLYVTDGGHYENLGLVELLRRGCTEVYCFDASGVGKGKAEFQELGDAIALARSEIGVEIHFETDPNELAPDKKTTLAKRDLARGTISYPDGSTGTLIYVRNSITAKAPWDALAYHKADPRFPHNPTVDQLYTDQKFEAYRVLGLRAGAEAVGTMRSA